MCITPWNTEVEKITYNSWNALIDDCVSLNTGRSPGIYIFTYIYMIWWKPGFRTSVLESLESFKIVLVKVLVPWLFFVTTQYHTKMKFLRWIKREKFCILYDYFCIDSWTCYKSYFPVNLKKNWFSTLQVIRVWKCLRL